MSSGEGEKITYLYRYEPYYSEHGVSLTLYSYPVVSKTPRGCWIAEGYCGTNKKFILDGARKRYAYPTAEEALVSLSRRNKKYIQILGDRLERAQQVRDTVQLQMKEVGSETTDHTDGTAAGVFHFGFFRPVR